MAEDVPAVELGHRLIRIDIIDGQMAASLDRDGDAIPPPPA
jgi:hypothetical protein